MLHDKGNALLVKVNFSMSLMSWATAVSHVNLALTPRHEHVSPKYRQQKEHKGQHNDTGTVLCTVAVEHVLVKLLLSQDIACLHQVCVALHAILLADVPAGRAHDGANVEPAAGKQLDPDLLLGVVAGVRVVGHLNV